MEAAAVQPSLRSELSEASTPTRAGIFVPSSAELAECTCPDWCERDHDRD